MPEENRDEAEVVELPETPAKKKSLSPILLAVFVAFLSSASCGVVVWFVVNRGLGAAAKAAEAAKPKEEEIAQALERGGVLPLEAFVVNLADVDSARYLRIKISLMLDDKTKVKETVENEALQLKVRDIILQTLTQKTSQELINDEGKKRLRLDIREKLEAFFRKPKLVDVMFTEFVIQL